MNNTSGPIKKKPYLIKESVFIWLWIVYIYLFDPVIKVKNIHHKTSFTYYITNMSTIYMTKKSLVRVVL